MKSCTAHSGGGRGVGPRQKARLSVTEGIWQRKPRFNKQGLYAWLWSGHLFILHTMSISNQWHVVPVSNHLMDTESEFAPWDPSKAHILVSTLLHMPHLLIQFRVGACNVFTLAKKRITANYGAHHLLRGLPINCFKESLSHGTVPRLHGSLATPQDTNMGKSATTFHSGGSPLCNGCSLNLNISCFSAFWRHHPSLADGDKYSLCRVSKMTTKSANYSPSEVLLDLIFNCTTPKWKNLGEETNYG